MRFITAGTSVTLTNRPELILDACEDEEKSSCAAPALCVAPFTDRVRISEAGRVVPLAGLTVAEYCT